MGFKAVRLIKDFKMLVPGEQDRIFPLLCPVRENEWLPYWSCGIVHSDSGKAEKDCVFITNFPDRGDMIWVTTKYDPPNNIQYTIFKPNSHVWNIEIFLEQQKPNKTQLLWQHTFTGLTPSGNKYLAEYTDAKHRSHLRLIEKALNHFVDTGKMIGDSEFSEDRQDNRCR